MSTGNLPRLRECLIELHLPAFREHYAAQAALATQESLSYPRFLLSLSEIEVAERQERKIQRQRRISKLPAVVQIAKLRVLIAVRMNLLVLLPEQLQSDRLSPQLSVHVGEIGWRAVAAPRSRRRKKLSFQLRLAHLADLFPVELGGPGPAQVITHGSPRHRAASSDLAGG